MPPPIVKGRPSAPGKPEGLRCSHCGEDTLIERINPGVWRCDCCSKIFQEPKA